MPMTAAERQRLYRQRLRDQNPQKYEELRLKNLNRIKKKYVKVSKLTENQKLIQRKNWRKLKNNQKKKRDSQEETRKSSKEYQRYYKRLKKENEKQKIIINEQRKKIQALQKKVYRQKILLDCQISAKDSEQSHSSNQERPLTPNSQSNEIIQTMTTLSEQDKNKVKKVILEKYVITEAIKQEYRKNKNIKKVLRNIFTSQIVQKYKMVSNFRRVIGLKSRIRNLSKYVVPKRSSKLVKKIRRFYLRDDVSRASAGKKETKTFKKQKHQKRYLLDTMSNLHKKFKEETGIKASVNTFRRHRPFYVVKPRLSDRETCVCKIHANIEFKFQALQKIKVLDPGLKLMDILQEIVCDIKSKECMYSECNICKMATVTYNFTERKRNDNVTWFEWTTKNVGYQKNKETKMTKKVVIESKTEKLEILLSNFEKELKKFKEHYFNIWYQYNIYRNLKNSLQNIEVMVHCDFSENYSCKFHRQIQAVHFGSQNQISLHTSVMYIKGSKPLSYCTLSDSTDHSPAAIWAHLKPILTDVKTKHPEIDTVHVFSDGPTTQYRQKKNFYLFKLYLEDLNYKKGTWNFSEAYHGKGAADGIGGVIKRLLDAKVSHGIDVLNTSVAYSVLKEDTNVNLYCIKKSDISEIKSRNQTAFESLVPIPDTMKIHQIQAESENCSNEVRYRVLSCFCNSSSLRGFCDCFDTKKHFLIKPRPKKRIRLSSSSDSEGCQPLVLKRKDNLTSFIDTSTAIQKSKYNIPYFFSNKSKIIPSVSGVDIGNSDSDDLEIFNISRVVNKTILPVINKENDNCNKAGFKKRKKNEAPVTILSDVRVNYSIDDLKQMISTKRHNVPSYDLKKDYPEMFEQSATAQKKVKYFFDDSSESE
ncbi:unnamed protein product [Diatraea saccharalis]|uniref:Uncharacterized protein n=1 Tax=Diatraea saccharalis TaxID=40085 RepID=A0A9N9WF82_9NEOP|nr:unnamed protein product [Diatraea saccharalis]